MRTKVYLFVCRLNFSLTVLMFLYRTVPTSLSSIIIVNVAKSKIRTSSAKNKRKKKHFLCVCVFNMEKSSSIYRYMLLLSLFVLVIVLIFAIDINFKWKQQTRREGQTINDDFPFILYLASSILFFKKFTPTQSIVFFYYLYYIVISYSLILHVNINVTENVLACDY